jgi:hypothetical protein
MSAPSLSFPSFSQFSSVVLSLFRRRSIPQSTFSSLHHTVHQPPCISFVTSPSATHIHKRIANETELLQHTVKVSHSTVPFGLPSANRNDMVLEDANTRMSHPWMLLTGGTNEPIKKSRRYPRSRKCCYSSTERGEVAWKEKEKEKWGIFFWPFFRLCGFSIPFMRVMITSVSPESYGVTDMILSNT